MMKWTASCWILVSVVSWCSASRGDRSSIYQECLSDCKRRVQMPSGEVAFLSQRTTCEWILQWTSLDQCRYDCMWESVDYFVSQGMPIPQYHGKWPFYKICGIQEPASTLFSVANGVSNIIGVMKLVSKVPISSGLYPVWVAMGTVAMNTWFWSTVFHCRDTNFTEMMDYFCAFSLVLFMFFSFFARLLYGRQYYKQYLVFISVVIIAFFARHVHRMAFIHFDYGHNMKVNVTVGAMNSICWLCWCFLHRKRQPYVWKAVTVILCTNILLLLELFDFPPFLWTFDAHALWHGGTSLLPLLWFSFCIDDCIHLHSAPTHPTMASSLPLIHHNPVSLMTSSSDDSDTRRKDPQNNNKEQNKKDV